MTADEREPTRDELMAMAYVDGELAEEARPEFEARLAAEPALRREVAELQRLNVIARQTAPPEPMDYEWQKLEREWLHCGGRRCGMLLMAIGVLGGCGWLAFVLFSSGLSLWPKILGSLALLGILVFFFVTLRARMRTLPYDPYTEVKR